MLICPECYPNALAELTRCASCDSVRLVRQLDQVECLDCRLARDANADPVIPEAVAHDTDAGLAAEVASALARVLGTK